jgi:hypothetical protein
VEAGYYFPTSKGGLQHLMRKRRSPEATQHVLELLLNIIRRGTFLPAEQECYLCRDYHLCGENKTRHNAMIENPLNKELASVRELKEST